MTIPSTLITELERQRLYISRLPEGYEWPLFNARVALESMRKSGYQTTAAAAREIVDNAIEAGANHIDVVIEDERSPFSTLLSGR